ncbi:immune inhibitor A [Croceifilum oryzae]|uniref:Immune inhibitor A n=1 Tax=Croceifilum oryzae TaxID=1553429 RepID=A0AAJ1TEJ2_9BACL|nr:immune inhibitor A domain-containing protein [Croceifilum oryzae]MDQ0417014.1 immune inhibitor A [Croceifilum oryzae]
MKTKKSVVALLTTSFLVATSFATPALQTNVNAIPKDPSQDSHIDWSVVNQDKLIRALKEQGKIKESSSQKEIETAVEQFVKKGETPFSKTDGIDTRSKFGKDAKKGKEGNQQKTLKEVESLQESDNTRLESNSKKSKHQENGVVALIEFPNFNHNQIKQDSPHDFWVKDFDQSHYQNLLFNANGFKTDTGKKYLSFRQYYLEQSSGYWDVDGTVTPWIQAKNDAAYYGGHKGAAKDADPRALVKETLETVGKQIAGNEAKYDVRDPYDLDQDGNVMEPDGILDALFIVHSGTGEEAGGGELGENAIWSHRSVISDKPVEIPGTNLKAFDYIIQPEDGAVGVFAHEYGHNIGLPDEYDTGYSGSGSPVEYWSIMSGGSWAGKVLGTEPTGFSPWAKLYFHETFGGNWPVPKVVDLDKLGKKKKEFKLDEAVKDGKKGKLVKVNLPDVEKPAITKPMGKLAYFSTKGDSLNTKMTSPEIDLTNATESKLSFDSWRDIEQDYDYLYVNVYADGSPTPVNIKTYTGTNGKWENEQLDLKDFVGKKIKVEFNYVTDVGLALEGFVVDNILVTADGKNVFQDNVEDKPSFTMQGFKTFDGAPTPFPNYYLIEWRTHNGVDQGLANLRRSDSLLKYDPGMVVWYYDGRYGEDNMTGKHPGEGFLGVVDSHQNGLYWDNGTVAPTRFQLADAAFGSTKTSSIDVKYPTYAMKYPSQAGIRTFDDRYNYASPASPESGKILPRNGLKVTLKKSTDRGRSAVIEISKTK